MNGFARDRLSIVDLLEQGGTVVTFPDKDSWRTARRWNWKRIGASEVPDLFALGFHSPLALYLDIQDRQALVDAPDAAPSLERRFRIGSALEAEVGEVARELLAERLPGAEVLLAADAGLTYHQFLPKDPEHLAVTYDGWVVEPDGQIVPLELKTVSPRAAHLWPEGGPAPAPELQAAAAAVAMGVDHAWLAAMVGYGDGPDDRRLYRVEVPPEYGSTLRAALDDLYSRLERNDPPGVATSYDAELMARLYPKEAPGKVIALDAQAEEWIAYHETLTAQRNALTAQIDASKARFQQALGDAAVGIVPGGKRAVRWRLEESSYTVTRSSRVLRFGKPSKAELEALD